MKIAYLLLAHTRFDQVVRLVRRLSCESASFFVHVDAKVPAADTAALARSLEPFGAVMVEPRVAVEWGRFTLVQATLAGMRAIARSPVAFDYVHLTSGQDYPLVSNTEIARRLARAPGSEFLQFMHVPTEWPKARKRYERYHFADVITFSPLVKAVVQDVVNAVMPRRKAPGGMPVYGGSQWWTLTRGCVDYILDFVERHPRFVSFFRATHCPDEMFFQTIVLDSPFRERAVNDHLRYIDWSAGGRHPRTLTMTDADALARSRHLFARKFDTAVDAAVLDWLDTRIEAPARQIA